ncbi:TetR family transcriptional regulator [Corynebacterium aquatimens]|uniref:TetR/AcrR family transcriptional regulator n=2 Tax=Corynebacterium TaxID=1716 RepID=UPI001F26D9B7|nr:MULTISPECIES: TetR/AcrR family transcriptional regulator [Corynebacterium]QYH20547.1 TetR family transcriptional regulator [Corynebacterium aquatimens]UIZ93401.1 TetR family transcriptional regulator [Corynebacterium sp. CNCTC7651]
MFASRGFEATTLEDVVKDSGVPKRALTAAFGDKRGLYEHALRRAVACISPSDDVLNRSYAVPVEGMRTFVDAMFHTFMENPDCVRLILRENVDGIVDIEEMTAGSGDNDVALHVERLLLLGQDAGAFRPGIGAEDVLVLIVALCEFVVAHSATIYAISRVDFSEDRNVDGMRRMVIDSVLAFLTSNIAPSGHDSYLVSPEAESLGDAEIY